MLAEIAVLFAGIVGRYVFHSPLVWSDELAGILFLWLAMLGSVLAFQRDEHMRMTAIVGKLGPARSGIPGRGRCGGVSCVPALVIHPAYEFAADEVYVTTPALEIVNAWRAAALPVGFGLMLVVAVLRLASVSDLRSVLAALALVAVIMTVFALLAPALKPLATSTCSSSSCFSSAQWFRGGANRLCLRPGHSRLSHSHDQHSGRGRNRTHGRGHELPHLLAVPLFVFLGLLIEMTGMARAMVAFLASLLGHVRGGLHYVLVGAMYLVSGISGSKAADMAAVAPVCFLK